jgi:CheY-like chemotaxis protein
MLTSKPALPRAEIKTSLGRRPPMTVPAVDAQTRILIIDQDRKVGMALSFMLAARRYDDVRAVRSAGRAVAIAEQFRPDIVFLDVDLPKSGTLTVARMLSRDARQRRLRLIGLTNDVEHPMYQQARAAGLERFLLKPVSPEELDKILGVQTAAA